jgi:hypothetical protein
MRPQTRAAFKRLADRFIRDREVFLSGDCREGQLRLESLDPVFTALGWEMDDTLDAMPVRGQGIVSLPPCERHIVLYGCEPG